MTRRTLQWLLALAFAVLVLMTLAAVQDIRADTLMTRTCPSDAAVAAGAPPDCQITAIMEAAPAMCAAIVADVESGASTGVMAAMPAAAALLAPYSAWTVTLWCAGRGVTFTIPVVGAKAPTAKP